MSTPIPDVTPNVVLANPAVRKALGWIVGLAAILVPLATIVDARSEAFDITGFTDPATAATSFLAGLLGLVVTVPNIPSKEKAVVIAPVKPADTEPVTITRDEGHGI